MLQSINRMLMIANMLLSAGMFVSSMVHLGRPFTPMEEAIVVTICIMVIPSAIASPIVAALVRRSEARKLEGALKTNHPVFTSKGISEDGSGVV